jgi:ribosomal protein S18 acetylase RimI-like enzyme
MMNYVEEKLKALDCPKINLMVRKSNLDVQSFYHKIGYSDDSVITLSKRLLEDKPYR